MEKIRPMVSIINPFKCIMCGGQLVALDSTTYITGKLIDPNTGIVEKEKRLVDKDSRIECMDCHRIYNYNYIIDSELRKRFNLDFTSVNNIVELDKSFLKSKISKNVYDPFYGEE